MFRVPFLVLLGLSFAAQSWAGETVSRITLSAGRTQLAYREDPDVDFSQGSLRFALAYDRSVSILELNGVFFVILPGTNSADERNLTVWGGDLAIGPYFSMAASTQLGLQVGYAGLSTSSSAGFGYVGMNGFELSSTLRIALHRKHHLELSARYVPYADGNRLSGDSKAAFADLSYRFGAPRSLNLLLFAQYLLTRAGVGGLVSRTTALSFGAGVGF